MSNKYDDIIALPHHESKNHRRMSSNDRAAQFLPFSALTGYDAAIIKASQNYLDKKEISMDKKEEINDSLIQLYKDKNRIITITYYYFDTNNNVYTYKTYEGTIFKIDINKKAIYISKDDFVIFDDIYDIKFI